MPDHLANVGQRSGDASRQELTRALTQPSEYDPTLPPVFAVPASVPGMPWKAAPTTGHLRGTVRTDEGVPFDQVRVDLYDAETDAFIATRYTDGSGWFGFVDLAPGRYKVAVDGSRADGRRVVTVTVAAGELATATLTPFARGQEGRRPPADTPIPTGVAPAGGAEDPNGER